MSWRRPLAVGLYLLAEALLWYIVLRTFASSVERNRFADLSRDITRGLRAGDFLEPDRAQDARAMADIAADAAVGGAPILVVIALAFTAFGLMRVLSRSDLPAPARAAAGVSGSIIAVTAAIQVSLAEGAPWEGGILTGIVSEVGVAEFVVNPDIDRLRGVSRTVTIVGLTVLWLRFLFAGRGPVTFDRVLRSFGVGFAAVVVTTLFSHAAGADVAGALVLPYFVIASLALATSHAARAPEYDTAVRRDAPWAVSVVGTVGLLAAIALLFGLLMLVDAQRAFDPIGAAAARVLTWVLIIILTPVAWFVEFVLGSLIGEVEFQRVGMDINEAASAEDEEVRDGVFSFPGWLPDAIRGLAVAIILVLLYRFGLLLFRRGRGGSEDEYAEVRGTTQSGSLASLFRRVVPRPRGGGESWDWLSQSRAYQLFARMVDDSRARGVDRFAGQTPIEFGADAGQQLRAPPFPDIAQSFDRTRYGRHEPDAESLDDLERRLDEWEREHPLPEEM